VAAQLRVLKAHENIRSYSELDPAPFYIKDKGKAGLLLDLASFDTEDAFHVLEERSLHLSAVAKLREAYRKEREAIGQNSRPRRNVLINQIVALKAAARADMLVAP
jgi:hypothetical protein